MESFFVCNGNETQEIVKPTGAHDFCFQRFIGMVCTRELGILHFFNSLCLIIYFITYSNKTYQL